MSTAGDSDNGIERLDGWQSIAGHLNVSVRTARRWADRCGMPVRTWPSGRSVCARPDELDAWMAMSLAKRSEDDAQ